MQSPNVQDHASAAPAASPAPAAPAPAPSYLATYNHLNTINPARAAAYHQRFGRQIEAERKASKPAA